MHDNIYSIQYSLPYFAIFLLLSLIAFLETKTKISKEASFRYCVVIFFFFFCFKGFVGWDWMTYYPMFQAIDDLTNFTSDSFIIVYSTTIQSDIIEPGFILYTSLLKTICNEWYFFTFVSSLIPVFAISAFIRKFSTNYAWSFLLFFALYQGLLINLIRNALSISVFLLALVYLKRNKIWIIVILSIIGISFHRTFVTLVPLFFLQKYKFSQRVIWACFLLVNVIFFLQIPVVKTAMAIIEPYVGDILTQKIDNYSNKNEAIGARGLTLGYFVRIFIFWIFMQNYKSLYSRKDYVVLFNAYFFYVLMAIGLSDMRGFVDRMETVYFFPFVILYPYVYNVMQAKYRRLYVAFLVLYSLLKTYSYTGNIMQEYKTMFNGDTFEKEYSIKREIGDKILDSK